MALFFEQAAFEVEMVMAPELLLTEVSNAHLAGPCPMMLLFSAEVLGRLAADLNRALHPQPGRIGTAVSSDQCSGYEGALKCRTFAVRRAGRARVPCATSTRGLTTACGVFLPSLATLLSGADPQRTRSTAAALP